MGERSGTVEGIEESKGKKMFGGAYWGKKVLLTGHCGVKGSWAALWLTQLRAQVYGISHPPRTAPSHYELLKLHDIMAGDIHADLASVEEINSLSPDLVIHMAARAIVAKSFEEPEDTFRYTVLGCVHLLELCRRCPTVKGVVVVETDKVYDNKEWLWGYREVDELGGSDPYSASKVCVANVVRCYRESFGMNIAAARAGNILAGGDWSFGRLLPDVARATAKGEVVMVHTPHSTRPFQHALDALSGYLMLGQAMLEGRDVNRAYNFGPTEGSMSVLEILKVAKIYWPKIQWAVDDKPTHKNMVYLLKLDNTKAKDELGWRPVLDMKTAVKNTIEWYKSYYEYGLVNSLADIIDYQFRMQEQR